MSFSPAAVAGRDHADLAGQIGFFPDARHPRVVWTRVRDERDRLPSLQRVVEAAAAEFGIGRDLLGHLFGSTHQVARLPRVERLTPRRVGALANLGLEGEARETSRAKLVTLNCSQCGGALELRAPDQAERAAAVLRLASSLSRN